MRFGNKETGGGRSLTNLMKKCVDEFPGNGTFIAPDAPCPVLAVGLGLGMGMESCIGSDQGSAKVHRTGSPAVQSALPGRTSPKVRSPGPTAARVRRRSPNAGLFSVVTKIAKSVFR